MKLGSTIRIDYNELTPRQLRTLKGKLTFATPQGDVVTCYRDVISGGYIKLPRGAKYLLNGSFQIQDFRSKPAMPKLHFTVKLDDTSKSERFKGQSAAVKSMFHFRDEERELAIQAGMKFGKVGEDGKAE